jgi:hypothetical protein
VEFREEKNMKEKGNYQECERGKGKRRGGKW